MLKMLKDQKGQTLVEYALLLALVIVAVVVTSVTGAGTAIQAAFNRVVGNIK